MSGPVSITFADSAVQDLEEIISHYEEQGVPQVGRRLAAEIVADIELLATHPETGRMVPEFGVEHLRELIRPPFCIVYRRERTRIRVVRVWRSERLLTMP